MSFLNMFVIIAVFLGAIVLYWFYSKKKQEYWSRLGVYTPPCNWFFGHFSDSFLSGLAPFHVLARIHKSCHGKDFVGLYLINKPILLVRSPELIKHILVKDFEVFSERNYASERKKDVVGRVNMFSISNPPWKYLRSKLSPAFSTAKQKKLFKLMTDSAEGMKIFLESKVMDQDSVTIDVKDVATRFTTDIISSLSFGIKTNSFSEPPPEFYLRSQDVLKVTWKRLLGLTFNIFYPQLNDLLGLTLLSHNEDYFRNVFWESMNAREKSGVKIGDTIDFLIDLKNEEQNPDFKFEGDHLLAQAIVFLLAGLESSASTMSFALYELARNSEIQKKVRDEITRKLKDEELTFERVSEMTYLQQIVSETLRMYTPVPFLDRISNRNYKIPETDIIIEKGTTINIGLGGLHGDPEFYPEPLKFDPDRFSETRKLDIKPFTYMPFGDGPRICIGMRTGLIQTMVGLIKTLRLYRISLNPQYKMEINRGSLIVTSLNGIHLYFEKVTNNK